MNKQKIEDLKHILQYPRLYLANYFEQLRNRIDFNLQLYIYMLFYGYFCIKWL